jgi:hypothetical protein
MATCGDLLKKADFSNNEHRQQLRSRVSVSDDYIVLRSPGGMPRPLWAGAISTIRIIWTEFLGKRIPDEVNRCWPKNTQGKEAYGLNFDRIDTRCLNAVCN